MNWMDHLHTEEPTGLLWECSFSLALRVVRRVLVQAGLIEEDTILSVCIAIDEYQTIPGSLNPVMQMLLDASIELSKYHKIHIYPIMAGTQWTKLDGTGSSTEFCTKVPLTFLSTEACLGIAREILPGMLYSDAFRDSVMLLGQLPRPLLFYLELVRCHYHVAKTMSNSEFSEKRRVVLDTYLKAWNLQPRDSLLKIIAYAITGIIVRDDDESPIRFKHYLSDRDPHQYEMIQLTWNQLAGVGLLQLHPVSDQSSKVDVPLAAILSLTASREEHFDRTRPYEWLFVLSLSRMIDLNLQKTNLLEPWQQWELFGAHYHAVRINAFLILGFHSVPLKDLFSGLESHLSDISDETYVLLKLALMFESDYQLSPQVNLKKVSEKRNSLFGSENLLSTQSSVYRICVNDTGGEGVDIVFVLFCFRNQFQTTQIKSVGKGKLVPFLILDQRKRKARNLTQTYVESLVNGMKTRVPASFPAQGVVIPLIFTALARTGPQLHWTKGNFAIYSRACLKEILFFFSEPS